MPRSDVDALPHGECRELLLEDGGIWPDVLDVTSTSETWEEVIQGISAISAALYDSVLPWAALTTSLTLPGEREGLIIRFFAAIVSFACLGLGYFWIFIDSEKRSWSDLLSQTRILHVPPR